MKTKDIKKAILKDIETDNKRFAEYLKIREILELLEGKEINGRTLNETRLNGFKFSVKYQMFHINGTFDHLIGYSSNPEINLSNFDKYDGCNGYAAKERAEQNAELLKPENFKILVKHFSTMQKQYEALKQSVKQLDSLKLDAYHFPAHYSVMSLIQPNEGESDKASHITYLSFRLLAD